MRNLTAAQVAFIEAQARYAYLRSEAQHAAELARDAEVAFRQAWRALTPVERMTLEGVFDVLKEEAES